LGGELPDTDDPDPPVFDPDEILTRDEQIALVCYVSSEYNIPGEYLLAVAHKESSINHWDSEGNVKISGDGGVGIMQVTGRSSCTSVDGEDLNFHNNVLENIKCGATMLLEKCDVVDCQNPSASKQHYCPNNDVSLATRDVTYTGWDMTIRAWNGWGCWSCYYKNMLCGGNCDSSVMSSSEYSACCDSLYTEYCTSESYVDLVSRIQSYVEDFNTVKDQYVGVCSTTPPIDPPDDPPDPPEEPEIPEEIIDGDKIGFYYLNPSFRALTEFDLEIFTVLTNTAQEYIEEVKECTGNDPWQVCAFRHKPSNWKVIDCDMSTKSERLCSFVYTTQYTTLAMVDDQYEKTPIRIRFALYFPLKMPDSPLRCGRDDDLAAFTVDDYPGRFYSMCLEGQNRNVLTHIIEAFETYDKLHDVSYTPLLLMTQCFVESSGGASGCIQELSGGMCQVECPDEYPDCHEDSDEGRRQNILAAAKLLNNKIDRIDYLQGRFDISNRDMIKLTLFAYNRGEGTILGIPGREYLNSTSDYLRMGEDLEEAMLYSCYEAYDDDVYGSCGGHDKYWCCRDVGGLGYAEGTIYEYEFQVCPGTERLS